MKGRVHYAILADMERYIEDFNPEDYEVGQYTDLLTIKYLRGYYNAHLPIDITAWIRVNEPFYQGPSEELGKKVSFVRDNINRLLRPNNEEWIIFEPQVISTHYSHSVTLPVYQIALEEYGIEIILRNNFYDWNVSIKSDIPLDCDFMAVFNPAERIWYCEGFPKDKIYGCYNQDHSQFTFEIISDYDLYTFFFILKNFLGIKEEK